MKRIPRQRLQVLAGPLGVVALALVLIVGGVLILSRRSSASPAVLVCTDDVAPTLALRTLAGEPDVAILDQAIEENKLDTALATLYYSTSLSDKERVYYLTTLGQKFADAKQKAKARYLFDQATSTLLLSPDPFDDVKANAHLVLGKNQVALGDRTQAERNFDYAYTIARYSAYVPEAQRRFILSTLASEYKVLGLDRKADEAIRAQTSLPPSAPASRSPARAELPPLVLSDEVKAATAWRMRAAQRVINSMGSKSNTVLAEARRNLEDALRAEDDLRTMALENRLGQTISSEERASLARSRSEWLVLRRRVAEQCFGMQLAPAWRRSLAETKNGLRQAFANYYLLRREMAVNLPDPVDAAQARVDLLRSELLQGKLGLYPDYPEQRLVSELAQATKERIDLREDGLYLAVLSLDKGGQYALTTADLWGRPAAMASAGLGMSFPTVRPPAYVFIPTMTPPPTATTSPTAMRTPATPRASPSIVPTFSPALGQPTQPTSPLAMASPTEMATFPTLPLVATATPTPLARATPTIVLPLPTPAPQPTSTPPPSPTPTPSYNYQVIYQAGPIQRQDTGNDNLHIVGMVVDQNGILIAGTQQRLSWCCPAGQAIHPRPTIDVDNGRFDFFVGRGQYTLEILDGSATTEPILVNTDVKGLTGYVEWEYTIQRTNRPYPSGQGRTATPTATPSATGTPLPPSPTPPLPGAVSTRIALDPGWNFVTLPLAPVTTYSAASLASEISNQINLQGGGVAQISAWDGARIAPYAGSISIGVGYFVNITGTNRVFWQMTGYPLVGPVTLNLNATQKTSIGIPYMVGGQKSAAQVRDDIDAQHGAGTFVRLWRMSDTQGNWQYYDGTSTGIPSFAILADHGYLIEVSRSVVWAPFQPSTPTPTPTVTSTPTVTPTPTATPFDTHEPNGTFDQAPLITSDTPVISYIAYPYDRDYYKFNVSGASTIYLSLTSLPDDYDLYLYNPARLEIEASFNGGQLPEYITRTVTTPGLYYALVQGAGPAYDAIKPYKLLVTLGPP